MTEIAQTAAPAAVPQQLQAWWRQLEPKKRILLAIGGVAAVGFMALVLLIMAAITVSAVFGAGSSLKSAIHTSSNDPTTAASGADFNERLSHLKMTKDMSAGTITIKVNIELKDQRLPTCLNCRFLVRLFDKNGSYITHFTSDRFYELYRSESGYSMNLPEHAVLTYPINAVELKEVKMAEFGIIPR